MNELPSKMIEDAESTLNMGSRDECSGFYAGIEWLLNRDDARIVYVDGVDMLHEVGETTATVYPSKESILKLAPCSAQCGVQKCILIPLEWVHSQNLGTRKTPPDPA